MKYLLSTGFLFLLTIRLFATEQKLIDETLKELNFTEIPHKLSKAELDLKIKDELNKKFPVSKKQEIINEFTKKYPLLKVGQTIDHNSDGFQIRGKINAIASTSIVLDRKRYLFKNLPKNFMVNFNTTERQRAIKKEIYLKYTLPANEFKQELQKELSNHSDYQKFTRLLAEKKVSFHLAEFDKIAEDLEKTPEDKMLMETLLNYYKANYKYLTSRKSNYIAVYKKLKLIDSVRLFNELKSALTQKAPPQQAALEEEILTSVVLIEGSENSGIGFLADFYGLKCIISNRHIFIGNENVKISDLNNNLIPVEGIIIGKGSDDFLSSNLIIYGLTEESKGKHSFIPVGHEIEINKSCTVYSQSAAGRVVAPATEKIIGLGPQTIEIENKFVQGNSGSPIIQNGVAISIATYKGDATELSEMRFAVKLSSLSIDNFEPFDLISYQRDLIAKKPLDEAMSKYFAKYEEFQKTSQNQNDFNKANQGLAKEIERSLNYMKKHTFTELMASSAKKTAVLAENVLRDLKNVIITKAAPKPEPLQEPKIVAVPEKKLPDKHTNIRAMHEFLRSFPREYKTKFIIRATYDGDKDINLRITSFADYRVKSLTIAVGAFDADSYKAYFINEDISLKKSIKSRETINYKLSVKNKLPQDVRLHIGVVDLKK